MLFYLVFCMAVKVSEALMEEGRTQIEGVRKEGDWEMRP
jgi:hypothetical protein